MFIKTEKLALMNSSTNPNLCFSFKDRRAALVYYFQEKKIIALLLKEFLTEQDYQTLYSLVQLPIPEEHSLAQNAWLPIKELAHYADFKTKEKDIKQNLKARLDAIKDPQRFSFVFNTPEGKPIYLLQSDIEKLDKKLLGLLQEAIEREGHLHLATLESIEQKLIENMGIFARRAIGAEDEHSVFSYMTFESSSAVVNVMAHQAYLQSKKCLKEGLPQLMQAITKMRFPVEFNNAYVSGQLEKALEDQLFTSKVRLYGTSFLADPEQILRAELLLIDFLLYETNAAEIKRLLLLVANPNAKNNRGQTLLNCALFQKEAEKAWALLDAGCLPGHNACSLTHDSDLMMAIRLEMPERLIIRLASLTEDLDYQNQLGETALMLGIQKNLSLALIALLIAKTKDVLAQDRTGNGVIDYALGMATGTQGLATIQKLVAARSSLLRKKNADGYYPFMQAVYACDLRALEYLLPLAPDLINEKNKQGETALLLLLRIARQLKNTNEIIEFLIKQGANPYAINKEQKNALELAERQEPLKCQLETSMQVLKQAPLSQDMIHAFVLSLHRIARIQKHHASGLAKLLIGTYLAYLKGLSGKITPRSNATLITKITLIKKQREEISVRYIEKILEDIENGRGQGHKAVLTEFPNLSDSFVGIETELTPRVQELPQALRSGRSFFDNRLTVAGENSHLLEGLEAFFNKENLKFGEDFAYILSNPLLWSLPKNILILMHNNQAQCKSLIKEWGLGFEDFKVLSQKKLTLLSLSMDFITKELALRNIGLKALIRLDDEHLAMVLNLKYRQGLSVLLDCCFSLECIERAEINKLKLLLEQPKAIQFFSLYGLNTGQILSLDADTFDLLAYALDRLPDIIKSHGPLDYLIQLPYKELAPKFIALKPGQELLSSLGQHRGPF